MNDLDGIESKQGVSKLGINPDRIRATLTPPRTQRSENDVGAGGNVNLALLSEATKISPVLIDRFIAGGALSDEQLDQVVGYIRGEYSLSGISNDWVRRRPGKPEVMALPLACTDLPIGSAFPNPLGADAPKPVPQEALPNLMDTRLAKNEPKPEKSVFGMRKRA